MVAFEELGMVVFQSFYLRVLFFYAFFDSACVSVDFAGFFQQFVYRVVGGGLVFGEFGEVVLDVFYGVFEVDLSLFYFVLVFLYGIQYVY